MFLIGIKSYVNVHNGFIYPLLYSCGYLFYIVGYYISIRERELFFLFCHNFLGLLIMSGSMIMRMFFMPSFEYPLTSIIPYCLIGYFILAVGFIFTYYKSERIKKGFNPLFISLIGFLIFRFLPEIVNFIKL